jgi:hypothetical protein
VRTCSRFKNQALLILSFTAIPSKLTLNICAVINAN